MALAMLRNLEFRANELEIKDLYREVMAQGS
jgi:hypothetical protein